MEKDPSEGPECIAGVLGQGPRAPGRVPGNPCSLLGSQSLVVYLGG
jgi:hypothetical protein